MANSKVKGFLKDSLLYGIGDGLGRMIGLVMLPILSRVFVPADYGSIDLLTVAYTFLLMGVTLNVTTGMQKKYYEVEDEDLKKMLSSACFFLFLFALGISFILFWAASGISLLIQGDTTLTRSVSILVLCLPIELIFNCLLLILRLERKAILFSIINIARVFITPLATVFFVVLCKYGIQGVFLAKLLSLFLLTSYLFYRQRYQFTRRFTYQPFWDLLRYSFPGYPGILAKQVMEVLPRYFLIGFSSLTAVGLFGIAFRVSQSINLYNNAFYRAWNPFAFSLAGKKDERHLYEVIFKLYAFSLILLVTTLALFAREVLALLTPEAYHQAYYFVAGIALYLGLRGLSIIFSTALYAQHQVSRTSYLNLFYLFLFIPAAFFLTPRFGATGLIAAMVLAMVIYFVVYMRVTLRYFPFAVPVFRLLLLVAVAGGGITIFYLLQINLYAALAAKSIVIGSLGFAGYQLLLSATERQECQRVVRRFVHRK